MKKTRKDFILDNIVGPFIAGLLTLALFAVVVKELMG